MELLTDLEDRTMNLYDPNFCYSDNEDASHVIGGYVEMKKENCIQSDLSSIVHQLTKGLINWKSIYSQSRQSETHFHRYKRISYLLPKKLSKKKKTIFPMKNKDLYDHDPRCIMSCGLMCDDIIMDYTSRIMIT